MLVFFPSPDLCGPSAVIRRYIRHKKTGALPGDRSPGVFRLLIQAQSRFPGGIACVSRVPATGVHQLRYVVSRVWCTSMGSKEEEKSRGERDSASTRIKPPGSPRCCGEPRETSRPSSGKLPGSLARFWRASCCPLAGLESSMRPAAAG